VGAVLLEGFGAQPCRRFDTFRLPRRMGSCCASSVSRAVSIALIGDLHGFWSEADVAYFNASDYELLLFTGDLGSGTRKNGVDVARSVARLNKPALVVAGNNDAPHHLEIAAEFRLQAGLTQLMRLAPGHPLANQSESKVKLCGYCVHEVTLGACAFSVVVGRPFAMGGNELSFPEALRERYGISDMATSCQQLCALVEQASSADLIFLAHNGPAGLGAEPTSIWGCDFRPEAGDWGDEDLAAAVRHAQHIGKRVRVVIAGHMHQTSTLARVATLHHEGVLFVNPARVPRVLERDGEILRHHMVLDLTPLVDPAGQPTFSVTAREVFVP
jgi:uncharacterized protein (TIGR04168 family)